MYQAEHCLYVDSAAWITLGEPDYSSFTQGLIEWLMTQVVGTLSSWGLKALGCGYPKDVTSLKNGYNLDDALCGGPLLPGTAGFLNEHRATEETQAKAFGFLSAVLTAISTAQIESTTSAAISKLNSEQANARGWCGSNPTPTCALIDGAPALACGAAVATAIWLDVGDWLNWGDLDWNKYDAKLTSPDYCG